MIYKKFKSQYLMVLTSCAFVGFWYRCNKFCFGSKTRVKPFNKGFTVAELIYSHYVIIDK